MSSVDKQCLIASCFEFASPTLAFVRVQSPDEHVQSDAVQVAHAGALWLGMFRPVQCVSDFVRSDGRYVNFVCII